MAGLVACKSGIPGLQHSNKLLRNSGKPELRVQSTSLLLKLHNEDVDARHKAGHDKEKE
jgi:hypothetical protein